MTPMKTSKVAISIPTNLLQLIDKLADELKMSRSSILSEGASLIAKHYERIAIAKQYDEVFSDPEVQKEQLKITKAFLSISPLKNKKW